MAYLGRRGASAALTSADIPDDSITAAKIVDGAVDFQNELGFLENKATTQNLSGTYSTERMYLNDSYTLTGDVTVTGHLALGSIADEDIVITQDSTERTITGSGTLEAGNVLQDTHGTDLTGMTGELGSVVTQATGYTLGSGVTFPAGHVIQVVTGVYSTETFTQSNTFVTTGIRAQIVPKSASSKFFITCNTSGYSHDGNVQVSYFTIYRDSTNLGAGQMGYADIYQGSGSGHDIGTNICISELDSPNTTNAITYAMYVRNNSASYKTSWSMNNSRSTIIVMEIAG